MAGACKNVAISCTPVSSTLDWSTLVAVRTIKFLVANHFLISRAPVQHRTVSTPPFLLVLCCRQKLQNTRFRLFTCLLCTHKRKYIAYYESLELENARFYLSNSQQSGKYGTKLLTFCSILLAHYEQLHHGSKQYWIATLNEHNSLADTEQQQNWNSF